MNAITKIDPAPDQALDQTVCWEGRPNWRSAAVRIWKVRVVAIYFAALIADGARLALARSSAPPGAWTGDAKLLAIAAVVLCGLVLLAWLTERTTRYTIDDRRIVMRYGIALPATLEIPFSVIEHVGIRVHRDHTGDIAVRLKRGPGVMYPKLWPHACPWKIVRAEPMLRCIPDAGVVGGRLCRAIAEYNDLRSQLSPFKTQGR